MLLPTEYASVPPYELLKAASCGRIGFDQRLARVLVDAGERAVADILRFLDEDRSLDPLILDEALLTVLQIIGSPAAFPAFLNYLKGLIKDGCEPPLWLHDAIRSFGDIAIEPLIELYREVGEEAGSDIAFLLASFPSRDPKILEVLQARLAFDPLDALILLGMHRDPAAKPLIERFEADIDPNHPSADFLRAECRNALRYFEEPPEPFPSGGDPWERIPAVVPPYVPSLTEEERLEFLDSPLEEHRLAVAEFYAQDALPDAVRDRLLSLAQSDPSLKVRAQCWETLGLRAGDEAQVRTALKQVLTREDAPLEERAGAMVGLSEHADDPEVRAWILQMAGNPATRAKAVEAMWRSAHPSFRAAIPGFLEDPDPEVRRNAILAVGYLGLTGELGRLRTCFDDESVRDEALIAYTLALPVEISPARVRAVLRKIEKDAGELSLEEVELVQSALDFRLRMHGYPAVFGGGDDDPEAWADAGGEESAPGYPQPGRNDPCPCGSGKKYKNCCGRP